MEHLYEMLSKVDGYIYPNEIELHWGILIVLYPYITGLVAGAFILASLERVFKVKVLRPTYQLALVTALAFLMVAILPLVTHLGKPFRAYEIMTTPQSHSAMAIFGFVYLWYLMVVLLLEIWFDYRRDLVLWSQTATGFKRRLYKILTLGVTDLSPKTVAWDDKLGYFITVVVVSIVVYLIIGGITSAMFLTSYAVSGL